jgi:hypothetical protein
MYAILQNSIMEHLTACWIALACLPQIMFLHVGTRFVKTCTAGAVGPTADFE